MDNNYEFDLIPTNTLANGAFDVLKLDAVEDPFTNVLSLSAINMEESYISSVINFINEVNNAFVDNKIKLYKEMVATDNSTVVLESFSDYYVQVNEIIQKTLKFLRYKIDSFISFMENFMDETKIIDSHKKALTDEIRYYTSDSREGYTYTITEDIPDLSALDNFNASLFDDLYKPMVNDMSSESIKEAIAAIDLEKDLSIFRAKVLNAIESPEGLNSQEFERMMYLIFRDNSSHMIELDIDAKDIKNIAERWFKHYELKTNLNKEFTSIKNSFESILSKIEKITKNNNNMSVAAFTDLMPGDIKVEKIEGKDIDTQGMMMSPDMMIHINIYTKAKIDQLHKYTDVICMVIGAKLDAIKNMIQQDRAILLDAIEVLDKPEIYYDARKQPKASSVDESSISEAHTKKYYKALDKARDKKIQTPADGIEVIKGGLNKDNLKGAVKGAKNIAKNKKKKTKKSNKKKAVSEGLFDYIANGVRQEIEFNKKEKAEKQRRETYNRDHDEFMKANKQFLTNIVKELDALYLPKVKRVKYYEDPGKSCMWVDPIEDRTYVNFDRKTCSLSFSFKPPWADVDEDEYYNEWLDNKMDDFDDSLDKVLEGLNKNPKVKKYGSFDNTTGSGPEWVDVDFDLNPEVCKKLFEYTYTESTAVSEGIFDRFTKKDNGLDEEKIKTFLPNILNIINDELQKSKIFDTISFNSEKVINSVITTKPIFKTKYVYIPFVYGELIDYGDSEFSNDTQKENTKLINKQITTRFKNINNKIQKYGDVKIELETDGGELIVHLYIDRDLLAKVNS